MAFYLVRTELSDNYCIEEHETAEVDGSNRRLEAEVRTALEYRESALFSATEVHY